MSKESSPRVNRDAPFLLRPHHIATLRRLVVGIQATTEEDEYARLADRARGFANQSGKGPTTRKDVIGTTEKDQATYAQRLIDLATDLLHSPGSRKVRIATTLERDGWCQACIRGDHCSQTPVVRRSLLEEGYIEDILRYANNTPGALNKIRIKKRPIGTTDGTKVYEVVLATDVETLKRILRNPFMNNRMY